jgi:hypothetical protein
MSESIYLYTLDYMLQTNMLWNYGTFLSLKELKSFWKYGVNLKQVMLNIVALSSPIYLQGHLQVWSKPLFMSE